LEILGFTEGQFFASLLLLARIAALFTFVPVLSHPYLSVQIKAGASLVLTVALVSMGIIADVTPPTGVLDTIVLLGNEALIGLLLGLTAQILFLSIQFGGQVIGVQIGLSMASIMDPALKSNISAIGYFYYFGALMIFLSVGGDRIIIEAFVGNLDRLPLGQAHITEASLKALIFWSGEIFSTGFRLISPVLAAIFCTSLLLGIFARSVPQINMLMLGYSLKILVGVFLVAMTLPMWAEAFLKVLARTFDVMNGMIHLIGSG
jgi:flagellar biosynthetic protein FliR